MTEQVNSKVAVDSSQVEKAIAAITNLTEKLDRYVQSTAKVSRAAGQKTKAIQQVSRSAQQTTTAMQTFNKSSQDLTKSVQVALGPLSGVAARITALTALFNRNTFAAAALIGAFTGFTVAAKRLVRTGIEFERQMLRMEAVVGSLGDKASFSAVELESMAQRLATATLASTKETRELVTVLATFENIAPEAFEEAATAAIGLSNVLGGQMGAAARQLGVLLQDPIRNMEMLRRRGIQFNNSEKERIKFLMQTFQVQKAQNIILEKFGTLQEVARKEGELAAGTLDYTAQLMQNFGEAVARAGNLTQGVTSNMGRLNEALRSLLENEQFINAWGSAFSAAANAVSKALVFISENIVILTRLSIALATMMGLRVVGAMVMFAAKVTGASYAAQALFANLVVLTQVGLKAWAAMKVGILLAGGLWVALGKVAIVIGSIVAGQRAFSKAMEGANKKQTELVNSTENLKKRIEQLPQDVRLEFSSNLDRISSDLKASELNTRKLRNEFEQLTNRQAETAWYLPITSIINLIRHTGELTDAQREQAQELLDGLHKSQAETRRLKQEKEELEQQIKQNEQAMRAFSGVSLEAGISQIRSLTREFLPAIAQAEQMERNVALIDAQLAVLREGGAIADRLKEEGITIDFLERLRVAVQSGGKGAKEAKDEWKSLANTFEDLQDNVQKAARELMGLDTSLDIPASLMRQFDELSKKDRNMLFNMGVTPESITAARAAENELNELTKFRTTILEDQKTEQQKVTDEVDKMLGMLDRAVGITEEFREETRNLVETYQSSKLADIIKKENEERHKAILEVENMYHHMNLTLMESELSRKDFAVAEIQEELRQKMNFVNDYVQKRVELEGGMTDEIAASEARLRERFVAEYQHKMNIVKDTHDNMRKVATGAAEAMESAFADFLFKPWEEGLKGMLTSFVMTLHRMVSELLAQQLLMSFFGAMGGTAGGSNVMSTMLRAVTAADGGYIQGPGTSTSDSIPARLSAGEYVINARAVKQIGVNALNAINDGNVARFSQGGPVTPQAQSSAGTRIINVIDPSLVQDYMNSPGGEKVVLNILQRNAGSVRQLVA